MRAVVLLFFGVHLAYAGTHSLKYFYTVVSENVNIPEFTAVGLVDEGQFMFFDSNIKKAVPKTEWIRKNEGADYWNRETQFLTNQHHDLKKQIQIIKAQFNQLNGLHTLQLMYGCELNEDGSTEGFQMYGYDGEDFIRLDKSTRTWTAANPQAVITKNEWEATGAEANYWKSYLESTCIEWLKKFVGYAKDTLERKVSPQVSLLQKSSSSSVTCHATGFYPRGITLSWQKNGQDHDEDVDLGDLLPNDDGTFQRSSTLSVTPDEWKNNKFICVVGHQDKTQTANEIRTNGGDSVPIGIIVGGVAAVLLLMVIGVTGFMVSQKKKKLASGSSSGSDSTSDKSSICSYSGKSIDSATALLSSDSSSVLENIKDLGTCDSSTTDRTKSLASLNSDPDNGYEHTSGPAGIRQRL